MADDRVNRVAHRALELASAPCDEPEHTMVARLRWVARNDPAVLDEAVAAALASDASLARRQAAIQLIGRARYADQVG